MRKIAALIIGFFLISTSVANDESTSWEISKVEFLKSPSRIPGLDVEKSAVSFKNGKRFVLPLDRAKPISVLHGNDGSYFLLAEGADCTACDENTGLRFYELNGSELKPAKKRYSYPGRLYDYLDSKSLLEETRTFYGQCLNQSNDVVVLFTKYFGQDSKWHYSNTFVSLSKAGDYIVKLEPAQGSLASVLKAVSNNTCKELPGINGTTEP